jgi:hypothetical protein
VASEKILCQFALHCTETQAVAVRRLALLHGTTVSSLLRMLVEQEWNEQAEALKALDGALAKKKKRAA